MVDRIGVTLRGAPDEFRLSLWKRWVKQFWLDRIENRPAPLSVDEADGLIEWTVFLPPVFADAVDTASRTSGFELKHTFLFSNLLKSDLLKEQPLAVIRLLVHILRPRADYTQHWYYLRPLHKRLKEIVGPEAILPLTEELVRLGCISALEPDDDAQDT